MTQNASAQSAVVAIDKEPALTLMVEPPLPGPLAQGVVFIELCRKVGDGVE